MTFFFVLFIFLTNIYNMVRKSTACHGNHLSSNKQIMHFISHFYFILCFSLSFRMSFTST
jgi:hypothetical protein